ncbi:MAG: UbiA family prenyltransferase [Desulfurococcales archaeon]|nr:UbiA family prenyltransferase [Desulfurococcales archaeon]
MGKALIACLRLMRVVNSFMVGLAVIVGVFIALPSGSRADPALLLSGFITGFAVSASSMILNDIVDIDIDKINQPDRPLPRGDISERAAWACYVALTLVGALASIPGGWDSLGLVLLAGAAAAAYNTRLKLSGFPGNVIVAFLTSLPFLYAYTLIDASNPAVIIFWAMVFLSVLGREIAKDIADVEGDAIKGGRTIPIVYGRRTAAVVAALFYAGAIILSPSPYLLDLVERPLAYILGVSIVDALLVYSAVILVRSPRKKVALVHKRIVLLAMLIGLITFLVSTL